ncbi:MAG TPA: FAD-binding oxidoreductase [Jiangellaceae bacterium]
MSDTDQSTLHGEIAAALEREVSGRIVTATDAGWDVERLGWDLSVDQRPLAVVHVTGPDDIVAAVRVAKRHGMSVTAQPVGHGATTAVDGTILLRTAGLRGLSVNVAARTARVDAGVRWRDLNAVLSGTGLTSLPGSSGDPTVVGYTLGGGMSWFGRKYGLAANHVRAVELVDPDGEHIRVTERSDPELFWALRGGGGDFGIVTAMEIGLMAVPAIYGGRLAWDAEQTVPVLEAFTEVAATAPDELTVWAWLLNLPAAPFVPEPLQNCWSVVVDLTYLGTAADAEAQLGPLRNLAGTAPKIDSVRPVPLAAVGEIAAEPEDPLPLLHDTTLLTGFDRGAVADLTEAVRVGDPAGLAVTELRRLGGALARPAESHGAAGHVDEPYLLIYGGVVATPELAEPIAGLIDGVSTAIGPYRAGRTVPNFAADAESAYPPEVLARLAAIKRQRDPKGVIRSNRPVSRP